MNSGKRGKHSLAITLALLLTVWLVAFLLPDGATENWQKIFSICGLSDFSRCADSSPFSLSVLSVGKADSIFVECRSGCMLIDGGTAADGEAVCAYLKKRGVKALDYLVNTHPDSDHVGGLEAVLRHFPTSHCLCPNLPEKLVPKTQEYTGFLSALKSRGLAPDHPKAGNSFHLGELNIDVLGPVQPGKNANDNSLVLKLTFGRTSFLLVGDAEAEEETSILKNGAALYSDVLKVGHHGSSTSTTEAFLTAVKPRYAVISVGNDTNALPRLDVSSRLKEAGTKIFRTDIDGTVIFLSDGTDISIKTDNPQTKGNS